MDDERGRERQLSRDRETIRTWADDHGLVPVRDATDEGFRLLPEDRLADDERVGWERFFEEFEAGDGVAVYHGEAGDRPVELRGQGDLDVGAADREERLLEGETVTSTVTETAVVESVVTEELTVESELVDSETLDQAVVDVDLVDRELREFELVAGEAGDPDEWFDGDRYLEAVGGQTESAPGGDATTFDEDLPYRLEGTVEETWRVTREATERHVVESEITDAEVVEAETLEDYDLDVDGLHHTIVESGIIENDLSTEEFLGEFDVESELGADDRVTTSFTRERLLEDELLDRREVRADVTGGEIRDMELVGTEEVDPGQLDPAVESGAVEGADASTTGAVTDMETSAAAGMETDPESGTGTEAANAGARAGPAMLDEDDVGKTVVDPAGDAIGTVADVEEGANAMYVDADSGLTERIKSALGWGDAGEGAHRLDASHVEDVTDEEVRLDRHEDVGETDRD